MGIKDVPIEVPVRVDFDFGGTAQFTRQDALTYMHVASASWASRCLAHGYADGGVEQYSFEEDSLRRAGVR